MTPSQEARKLRKRKARELETRKHLVEKQLVKQRAERVERDDFRQEISQEKAHRKTMRQMDLLEAQYEATKDSLSPKVRKNIENSIELLRVLEQEHEKEAEAKRYLNDRLEDEGALSLKEKLELLDRKNKDANSVGSVGGGADCSFKVNESSEK